MTNGHEPVRGKVAVVLNSRQLVINRGSDHGVEKGMRFSVQEELSITDPDNGEPLGGLPREVVKVQVIDVYPRYALAHTYETYSAPAPLPLTFDPVPLTLQAALGIPRKQEIKVKQIRTPEHAQNDLRVTGSPEFAVVDRGYLVEEEAA